MKRFRQFLNEGGNAITSASRIDQENVAATLKDIYKRLLPVLKLKKSDVATLGSTGKKAIGDSSGDIDLAVNVNAVIKAHNIQDPKKVYPLFVKALKKTTNEIKDSSGLGVVSGAWPIINTNGKQKGQKVQLDLMGVDDLKLSQFTYWSPSFEQSKWKGVHRNSLLIGIAGEMKFEVVKIALDNEGVEIPVQFKKTFFDIRKGVVEGLQSIEGKNGKPVKTKKTLETVVIAGTPIEIVKMLLGPGFTEADTVSFESIFEIVKSHKHFIWKENREKIFKYAAGIIKSVGATLPDELISYKT